MHCIITVVFMIVLNVWPLNSEVPVEGLRRHTRVLLCDLLFPSTIAKWRIEETRAFIETYDTDILVPQRLMSFAGRKLPVDFEETQDLFLVHGSYDLLIFDPAFNYLQSRVNDVDFNGTAFNGRFGFSFMLRKRTRRHEDLDFTFAHYDAVYSIFQVVFELLMAHGDSSLFSAPHFIHLYPGGGINVKQLCRRVHKIQQLQLYLVVTMPNILEMVQLHCSKVTTVVAWGPTSLPRDTSQTLSCQQQDPHAHQRSVLGVAMSSVGDDNKKGLGWFRDFMLLSMKMLPDANIHWYVFGQASRTSLNITDTSGQPTNHMLHKVPMLHQTDLDGFYAKKIHVYVNAETGGNGWPLGIEAMLTGAVLFSVDHHNVSRLFGFHTMSLTEQGVLQGTDVANFVLLRSRGGAGSSPQEAASILARFYHNRDLLAIVSKRSQKSTCGLVAYERQQGVIFSAIDRAVARQARRVAVASLTDASPIAVHPQGHVSPEAMSPHMGTGVLPRSLKYSMWTLPVHTCVLKHYRTSHLQARTGPARLKVRLKGALQKDMSLASLSPCITNIASQLTRATPHDGPFSDDIRTAPGTAAFRLHSRDGHRPSVANAPVYGAIQVGTKDMLVAVLSAAPVCPDGSLGGRGCAEPAEVSLLLYFLFRQKDLQRRDSYGVWADVLTPAWWSTLSCAGNLSYALNGQVCVARCPYFWDPTAKPTRHSLTSRISARIQCPLQWDGANRHRVILSVHTVGATVPTFLPIVLEARSARAPPANLSVLMISPVRLSPSVTTKHINEFIAYHSMLGADRFYSASFSPDEYAVLQPYLRRVNMFLLPRLLCSYLPFGCYRASTGQKRSLSLQDASIWRNYIAHEFATDKMMLVIDLDERMHCYGARIVGDNDCQVQANQTGGGPSHVELLWNLFQQSEAASLAFAQRVFGRDATPELLSDPRPETEKYVYYGNGGTGYWKYVCQPQFCVSGLSPHACVTPVVSPGPQVEQNQSPKVQRRWPQSKYAHNRHSVKAK